MTKYEIIILLIKYVISVLLIINLTITRKAGTLIKSIVISFITVSGICLVNLVLQQTTRFNSGKPFYYFNFIDFIIIVLIVNIFIKSTVKEKLFNLDN